jgi:hypothetical protein
MSAALRARLGQAFSRQALPLGCYYGVTLALPLANGAGRGAAFVEHALIVLVMPPLLILLAFAVHALIGWTLRSPRRARLR